MAEREGICYRERLPWHQASSAASRMTLSSLSKEEGQAELMNRNSK